MSQPRMSHPLHLLAFGFGSGLAPVAPGTFGTLVGLPLFWLLAPLPLWGYLAVVVVLFAAGVWLCDQVSRDLGVHDHAGIVWDEIVGYLVVMSAMPRGEWEWMLAGFLLFRLFDIVKPWPIGWVDRRVSGGFGIMLDDLLAALYGVVLMQLAYHLL